MFKADTCLHLGVITPQGMGRTIVPDKTLKCIWPLTFCPHAKDLGKLELGAYKKLSTYDSTKTHFRRK
eukprot:11823940-Ditylum_brightwellii.AAC.1